MSHPDQWPRSAKRWPKRAKFVQYGIESRAPLLTAAEEKTLAIAIQAGDRAARDRLILANLRLVIAIAQKFTWSHLDFDELVAEGNLGLIAAVDQFDPVYETKFSTFACRLIHQVLLRVAQESLSAAGIHVPRSALKVAHHLDCHPATVPTTEDQRTATLARQAQTDARQFLLAEDYLGEIPDTAIESADEGAVRNEERQRATATITHLLARLDVANPLRAAVIRGRFGIDGPAETLRDVGRTLGLSKERIRQIELQGLKELSRMAASGGKTVRLGPISSM